MSDGPLQAIDRSAFRKRRNYYLARASELARPLLEPLATAFAGAAAPASEWRKGLILGHNHIGDVLYRTCSLDPLARSLPDCEWHYLTGTLGAEVLRGNPSLSRVLPYQRCEDSWTLQPDSITQLRRERYDVVLCTNTLRSYPDFALACALRIPTRVGYTYKGFSALVNHPVGLDYPSPYPGYFRGMVAQITGSVPTGALVPRLFPGADDEDAATKLWIDLGLGGRPVLACAPLARAPGSWPLDHVEAIVQATQSRTEIDLVLCGGAEDRDALYAMRATLGTNVRVLAGNLNVRAFSLFLGKCSALFCVDSGPRHIGNTARIPVAFLRNLTFKREEAGTYAPMEFDLAPSDELIPPGDAAAIARSQAASEIAGKVVAAMRGTLGSRAIRA